LAFITASTASAAEEEAKAAGTSDTVEAIVLLFQEQKDRIFSIPDTVARHHNDELIFFVPKHKST
jgi:hypothetical protein